MRRVSKDLMGPREKLDCQERMAPLAPLVNQGSLEMLDPRDSREVLDCLETLESRYFLKYNHTSMIVASYLVHNYPAHACTAGVKRLLAYWCACKQFKS